MKFSIDRETLLRPLQLVTGVVERRQTLPVLSNVLVSAADGRLTLTGTDLEVELRADVDGADVERPGEITIPARKLSDICRSLPEGAKVSVETKDSKANVRSGRSRFSLATLPASEFPQLESSPGDVELNVPREQLNELLDRVAFSMAQQDVRYFLNGMLFELADGYIRTVATDGHRLAMCTMEGGARGSGRRQAIVPRKGVLELGRVLDDGDEEATVYLADNHLRVACSGFQLTTKLIDGKFPDYDKVIPKGGDLVVQADRETIRQGFQRAAILSNEKYRGVRLMLSEDSLTIQANNPEQEEAEEEVPVDYAGTSLEIGFNVGYLLDVMAAISNDSVTLTLTDTNSSVLIESAGDDNAVYVVMPMRL